MIIETVSLTTTPKTILALLEEKGRSFSPNTKIRSVTVRIDEGSTATVSVSEANTVAPVKLLDPANSQPYASTLDAALAITKLSASGNVNVGLIIS